MKTTDLLVAPQLGGASALPSIHNDLTLRPVLNELSAWRAVVEQILEVDKALVTAPRPAGIEEDVAAVLLDELTAGRGIPEDIEARVAAIGSTVSARHAVRAGLNLARGELAQHLDQAVRDNVDELLASLHERLQQVVADTRKLGSLDALAGAEAAVASDRVEEYRQMRKLGGQYAEVRKGQGVLMRGVGGLLDSGTTPDHELARLMPVSSALAAFPQWAEWSTHGVDRETGDVLTPPWPHGELTVTDRRQLGTGPDFLAWAVAAGVALWVPTVQPYRDANTELEELRNGALPAVHVDRYESRSQITVLS